MATADKTRTFMKDVKRVIIKVINGSSGQRRGIRLLDLARLPVLPGAAKHCAARVPLHFFPGRVHRFGS
jgi:hypothetical protein